MNPFNFDFSTMRRHDANPRRMNQSIVDWLGAANNLDWPREDGAHSPWSNWVSGNHDNARLLDRVGEETVDAVKMITYMVPGIPTDYYGDEIGMIRSDYTLIPPRTKAEGEYTRLVYRAPMSWTPDEVNAGFSNSHFALTHSE